MKRRFAPVICSIGSVDPTGAAGLTTDLAVYARLGAKGVAVVAGVTAQNAVRVAGVSAIAPARIAQQLCAVWEQVEPDAVCVGLLPGVPAIEAVERFLRGCRPRPPIVIDPVIRASSGKRFLGARGVRALRRLLPLATIVTPNAPEASLLTGLRVTALGDAEAAARALAAYGCASLVTGGHLRGRACVDVLAMGRRNEVRSFISPRLPGSMRGAGGILAAAIAVELGRGLPLETAIAQGRRFVRYAHRHARPLGSGIAQFSAP